MRHMHTITKALVVLLMLSTGSVHGSVIYSFVGTGEFVGIQQTPAEPVAFQLTTPEFLNLPICRPATACFPVTFTCAQLDSSTNCLQQAAGPGVGFFFRFNDIILFTASNNTQYDFY